jgi:hypothetical protein
MADARLAHEYIEGVTSTTSDSQVAAHYIEVITQDNATTDVRQAAEYIEAVSTNTTTTDRRIAAVYIDVLTPAFPSFIGWGTPL